MLLTKHNIPILNGDFVLPAIKDSAIRQTLADLSPEPPAALPTAGKQQTLVLSDIRRAQNSGLKFVQLVLEQPQPRTEAAAIKKEAAARGEAGEGAGQGAENMCTICGETVPDKLAFNAHIRAHLKEKLSSKMKKQQSIKSEPVDKPEVDTVKRTQPVKRKMTCSPEKQPARMKIKLEAGLDSAPEMDTPSPEPAPSLDMTEESFLSTDISQRLDLSSDISLILDQIEKDFDSGPGSNLTEAHHLDHLDTPPESDSDSDIFSFLHAEEEGGSVASAASPEMMMMVPPRLAESSLISDDIENLLNQTASTSDHDYLLNTPPPAPAPAPPPSLAGSPAPAPQSNISKVLISTGPAPASGSAPAPAKTFAIVNHTTGRVFIQREGAPARTVTMIRPGAGAGAGTRPPSAAGADTVSTEAASSGAVQLGPGMANANIIETTKGSDGEKEYKIVMGEGGARSKMKSKQTADCNICGKSITTKNMARHMEKHTGKKKFQCDICQASFFQKTHLKNHIVLHESGECHECPECAQKFLRRTDLQKHQKTVHCTEIPYFCNTCGLKFPDSQTLDLHCSSSACGERRELCGLCGEKFKDKEAMIVHMQTHTATTLADKQFCCSICHKTFAQKGHLNRHLKNQHGEGGEVSCRTEITGLFNQRTAARQPSVSSVDTAASSAPAASDFMSLLSPGSLSSQDLEFFEEESNSSRSMFSQSPVAFFPPTPSFQPHTFSESTRLDSLEDNFSSFLNDFDSDSPLINDSISGDKSFSSSLEDTRTRPNLTFDDISDASFFDISSQLDENIYDADLFSSMK